MKTVGYVLIFIVFISLFGGLNYYIGLRGWQRLGSLLPFMSVKLYWIIFWAIALSYVAARLGEKFLPGNIGYYLDIIGGYWMAAMLYFLIVIPIADIIRFAGRRVSFIPQGIKENTIISTYSGILGFALVLGILIYGTLNARNVKVTEYSIDMPKKAGNLSELKIALISDLHLGGIVDNARLLKMVDKINELKPDIVLIAGDIIDDKIDQFNKQNMAETLKKINSKYGVYAATGNHDYYGGDVEELIKKLEASGIKVLNDEYAKVVDSFYVAGRQDIAVESYYKRKRKPVEGILEGADKNLPIILIDHNPKDLNEPQKAGVDLQVSGHTHRGQMYPSQFITSKIYELDFGYLKKENLNVVVSSGIGTWGPPIRVGNSSELVSIVINFKQ
jgi:predicted MPP superfamily phosphohydrolase